MNKLLTLVFSTLMLVAFASVSYAKAPSKSDYPLAKAQKAVDVATCYECHTTVEELHTVGIHKGINCISCHGELAKHVDNQQ
ncbi:MAG: hypothetical protein LBV09_04470, partial [Deferribacteraceae bacterium]|nr:hypothetical protein [Deferribacteraceae bacterium]